MHSIPVAIKVLKKFDQQNFIKELQNTTCIIHLNAIQMYGVCYETELCLVYAYLEKGSLRDFIFQK